MTAHTTVIVTENKMGAPKIAPVEADVAEAKVDVAKRGTLLGFGAVGIAGALGLKARRAEAQQATPIAAGGCDAVPDAARRAQCRVDELEVRARASGERARASGQRADAAETEADCSERIRKGLVEDKTITPDAIRTATGGRTVRDFGSCNTWRALTRS